MAVQLKMISQAASKACEILLSRQNCCEEFLNTSDGNLLKTGTDIKIQLKIFYLNMTLILTARKYRKKLFRFYNLNICQKANKDPCGKENDLNSTSSTIKSEENKELWFE